MPLHHAVLALLAAKPAHGYELKASFEEAVGEQWGGLNIGHLYQILDRLRRDGLVETERQPQPIKPDRLVHHLTPAGRQELDRWLAAPTPRARGYRDDFFLKLMAAVHSGDGRRGGRRARPPACSPAQGAARSRGRQGPGHDPRCRAARHRRGAARAGRSPARQRGRDRAGPRGGRAGQHPACRRGGNETRRLAVTPGQEMCSHRWTMLAASPGDHRFVGLSRPAGAGSDLRPGDLRSL